MKWFFRALIVVLLVGGWVVAARSLHVIRSSDSATSQDRFGLIPKARWRFDQTYIDVRSWTPADLSSNAELVRHLCRSQKADLMIHVVPPEHRSDPAAWLLAALDNPAATQAATTQADE